MDELHVGKTATSPEIEVVLVDNQKEIRIRCENDEQFSEIMDAVTAEINREVAEIASTFARAVRLKETRGRYERCKTKPCKRKAEIDGLCRLHAALSGSVSVRAADPASRQGGEA